MDQLIEKIKQEGRNNLVIVRNVFNLLNDKGDQIGLK